MPSLSQPFRLAILPKIASLSNFATQTSLLQVADDFSAESNKLTIGISGSAISQYIINPTPKLTFNLPIPSTNNVTSCNVAQFNSNAGELLEICSYGLIANKSSTLNVCVKTTSIDKFNTVGGEVLETYTIKCDDEIVSIAINATNKTIVVALNNGFIQFYDFKLKLFNSFDISYDNIVFVEHFVEDSKKFVFVLSSIKGHKVSFKLFELFTNEKTSIKEISSTILEDFSASESKVCYQFGRLYRLSKGKIFVYALPQCQLHQTITLPQVNPKASQVVSFKPISSNRIILTVDNKVYILDLFHNSVLSERVFNHVKTFQLLKSAIIDSNDSSTNNKTIAMGVSIKSGPNPTSALEVINIDVGTGTLKDSLGKGFDTSLENTSIVLKPLFEDEDDSGKAAVVNFDYEKILKELTKYKGSITKFDVIFFNKLNISKDYYTDNDRFLFDQEFLKNVLDLIFENFKNEFPRTLTFLLTHPLFPVSYTKDLLTKFRDQPRLFKQAVVTCPNLPLSELLAELFSITNGELSLDISLRILQDYTRDAIKYELKKLSKVDLQNFIEFIIDSNNEETSQHSPQLFHLLSLVLDASGLFSLESELLEKLSQYIDKQVNIVERNNKLWHLLDDKSTKHSNNTSSADVTTMQNKALSAYSVEYLEL